MCLHRARALQTHALQTRVFACMHTLNAESLLDYADEAIAELESQKRQAAAAGTVACMRGDMRAHLSGAACAMHIDRSVLNLM